VRTQTGGKCHDWSLAKGLTLKLRGREGAEGGRNEASTTAHNAAAARSEAVAVAYRVSQSRCCCRRRGARGARGAGGGGEDVGSRHRLGLRGGHTAMKGSTWRRSGSRHG
jgi:hypothetical protein